MKFIIYSTDKLQRIFHPPNPQKWNENNLAAKDQFEKISGYTYFGIIDHDEFIVPSRIYYLCEDGIEKIRPSGSPFVITRQAS